MYPEYFGLSEPSFSITPDPHYLFLSTRHREALAHLLYGTGESGGFVQLTGEVGTGKTTICRAFLEQVPDKIDIALILNPALSKIELLQSVCEEFGIKLKAAQNSSKQLVDQLNQYLLAAHADGRRAVLIIDEAQNLNRDVLEQIRLLTNLETAKNKLLQIFLIGQPELRNMLKREDLRQLAQRITARYHLTPLDARETNDYIQHRLAVAGVERKIFTDKAVKQIYRLSGGVPRLINILCDRALLGAYATHRHMVDKQIVRKAAQELQLEDSLSSGPTGSSGTRMVILLTTLIAVAAWFGYSQVENNIAPPVVVQETPEPQVLADPGRDQDAITKIEQTKAVDIESLMTSSPEARTSLLQLWRPDDLLQSDTDYCAQIISEGLVCHHARGTWNNLRHYQRPALLQLRSDTGDSWELLVTGLTQDTVQVVTQDRITTLPITVLDPHWFGNFTLLWQPAAPTGTFIGPGSSSEAVHWLRDQLGEISGQQILSLDEDIFDESLKKSVQQFQLDEGLVDDGIVGPETLIYLNSHTEPADGPRLLDSF